MTADDAIRLLGLKPHPVEGGFFRETYRSAAALPAAVLPGHGGPRSVSTAIYYLLKPGHVSELHVLPGDEVFHFYLGSPVRMLQLWPDGSGQEVVLGPSGYIVKPRGEVHAMWNAGSTPARMIEVISPAGFEGCFRELSDLTATGPVELPAIAELAERYQLPFAEPDWLPDVIARYNLKPPPQG